MKIFIDVELPEGSWPEAEQLALYLQQEIRFMVSEAWGTETKTGSKIKTWFLRERKNCYVPDDETGEMVSADPGAYLLPQPKLSLRESIPKQSNLLFYFLLLFVGVFFGMLAMFCVLGPHVK